MLVGQTKVELENKTFFVSFSRVCNSWAHLGFLWTQSISYLAIKNEDIKRKERKNKTNNNNNNKKQKPGIGKTIPNNKRTSCGITMPDLKVHYKAIVINTTWYRYSGRQVDK